jgi:DsbC/DsbD-like thiol-disulfide interchange protein
MDNPQRRAFLRGLSAALLGVAASSLPVAGQPAETASAWSRSGQSEIRLLAGGAVESGRLSAGVEIRLTKGYKTYWRSPGDSGIPPRFDWSGSENLGSVETKWPVPSRFSDESGFALGYVEDVIFPLSITPIDPAKPVTLRLKLDYAVCEKLCIPAQGEASVKLTASSTRHQARIASFEAQVPQRVAMGADGTRLAVVEAAAMIINGATQVSLALTAPPALTLTEVLLEGPDMWAFGKATLTRQTDGQWRAVIGLHDRPMAASGKTPLLVTLIGTGAPVEVALDLDIPAATP